MSLLKYSRHCFGCSSKSRFYLDDEYVVHDSQQILQYTRLDIPEFRDTLIQHMESVKKSIGERAQHKMKYDSKVNERLMQTTEEKTDTSNALDASSVNIESNGTESQKQDTSSRSGNDAHHTKQPEFINEGKVDQNAEQCHEICPLPAKLTDDKTTEISDQSLESENVCLKKIVAQFQNYFGKLEAHCINLELQLQMENNVLKSGQQSQFLKEKGNEAKVLSLSTGTSFILQWKDSRVLVAKKKDISENRGSRNLEIDVHNDEVEHSSSSLVHQGSMLFETNNSSRHTGLVLHQMTSDHNRSELRIQDHSNEPSSSKLVPKVVP
ncbi:hypothetical protein Tco_0520992 [Tanacetum coccineum]